MMKKTALFILSLIFIISASGSYAADKQFDTMVVFGDSISDTGNLYRFMWQRLPLSPPYYQGRFTNGPVWIEHLYNTYFPTESTDKLENYAVGGAGAVLSYKENLPYTLKIELENYFYWHPSEKKDNPLFMIWIGGNNYLNGPVNVDAITSSVVNSIGRSVEQLILRGGNKFFLANLPDLGALPQATEMSSQTLLTHLTQVHNHKMTILLSDLKAKFPEVTFVYFDVYSFVEDAMAHAQELGFSNVTDACYLGSFSGWLRHNQPNEEELQTFLQRQDPKLNQDQWQMIKNNPQLREAAAAGYTYSMLPAKNKDEALHCDEYVFWDHVHPSARTHELFAKKIRELLDESGLEAVTSVP